MFEDSKLLIPGLLLLLVLTPSLACAANTYRLSGGGMYTTLKLTDLNNAIENYNDSIEQFEQEGANVSKMDKINQAFGFFVGTRMDVGGGLALGGTVDTFTAGTGTDIDYEDQYGEIDVDLDIDLSISGLAGTVSANINDYIGVSGGGGYYLGTINMSSSITATGDYSQYSEDNMSESADVSGTGFKAGGHINYPFSRQVRLYSAVHYRILDLEVHDDNSLTNGSLLNANGVEVRFGISFGV